MRFSGNRNPIPSGGTILLSSSSLSVVEWSLVALLSMVERKKTQQEGINSGNGRWRLVRKMGNVPVPILRTEIVKGETPVSHSGIKRNGKKKENPVLQITNYKSMFVGTRNYDL